MKEERFEIRLDKNDKEYMQKIANKMGISISEFVRVSVRDGGYAYVDYSSLDQLNYQISQIGNNINQIARGINIMNRANEKLDITEINETSHALMEGLEKIEKIIIQMYKKGKYINYRIIDKDQSTEIKGDSDTWE